MPLSRHYAGHGAKVMKDMQRRYGRDAERVFYATEAKRKKLHKPKRRLRRGNR